MTEKSTTLSLATLNGGDVLARIDAALADLGANIVDPSTPATAKRALVVKVELKPDSKRQIVALTVDVKTQAAAPKKEETSLQVVFSKAGASLVELEGKQEELFEEKPKTEPSNRLQ